MLCVSEHMVLTFLAESPSRDQVAAAFIGNGP